MSDPGGSDRLALFKALGDNTRYAIYLELARSPAPRSTAQLAERLGLHANTVRPHLERMRELGLLEVRPRPTGSVGRPQHLYSLADDAPSLGLEPPVYPALSAMLLALASEAGLSGDDARDVGRSHGRTLPVDPRLDPADSVERMLRDWGFDPQRSEEDDATWLWFGHCPFAELAEANTELVCSIHRGLIDGVLDSCDEPPCERFCDRSARTPCCVAVDSRPTPTDAAPVGVS